MSVFEHSHVLIKRFALHTNGRRVDRLYQIARRRDDYMFLKRVVGRLNSELAWKYNKQPATDVSSTSISTGTVDGSLTSAVIADASNCEFSEAELMTTEFVGGLKIIRHEPSCPI